MSEEKIILLRSLIKFFELAAALTGLLLWKKWKISLIKYFVLYLLVICFCEFTGYFLTKGNMIVAKGYLYKFFVLPFEFSFYTFLFYKTLNDCVSKKIISVCYVSFILCWLFEILFLDKSSLPFSSFSYSVGNIFLLLIIFRYFSLLIKSNQLLSFFQEPIFWISIGAMIFYLGSFPYYLLFNTLAKNYYKDIYLPYHLIVIFMNYIMYTTFICTFIWTKPK